MQSARFLILEADDRNAQALTNALIGLGKADELSVDRAKNLLAGAVFLAEKEYDMVFASLNLPDSAGLDTLLKIQDLTCAPVAAIYHALTEDEQNTLLRNGAYDVLNPEKYERGKLALLVENAVEKRQRPISESADANIDTSHIPEKLKALNERLATEIASRRETQKQHDLLVAAVEHLTEAVSIADLKGRILYVNPAFEKSTGFTTKEIIGKSVELLLHTIVDRTVQEHMEQSLKRGENWRGRIVTRRHDNNALQEEEMTLALIKDSRGKPSNVVAVKRDIGREAYLERQLLQAQKLESIGRLAAGIAHEINTPAQYVGDNVQFLVDAAKDICDLVKKQQQFLEKVKKLKDAAEAVEDADALIRSARQIELDYYLEEVPSAAGQALEGINRITEIVRAMKEFSHPGGGKKELADINKAVQSTVTVCRNEWKYVADIVFDFQKSMPPLYCHVGEVNQVFLNIIINAAHAVEPKLKKTGKKGTVTISTSADEKETQIRISDTGIGISSSIRDKIFDPFFTTKGVGKGTGQGLAIAYSTIVDKHHGTIEVDSREGEGTTFTIRLPRLDF